MRTTLRWVSGLGFVVFLLRIESYIYPEFFCIIATLIVFVILTWHLLRSLFVGFSTKQTVNKVWILLAVLCAVFILSSLYLAPPVGRRIADRLFVSKQNAYATVVDHFSGGALQCAASCNGVVAQLPLASPLPHVNSVWAGHCPGGGIVLQFLEESDVPLLHHGYMFKNFSGGDCSGRNLYTRQVKENWYRFSDQPGF